MDARALQIDGMMTEMEGTWTRGDWMQTFTGRKFYPLSPQADEIDPVDIAHEIGRAHV